MGTQRAVPEVVTGATRCAGAVGVVFDRRALDLSEAFIWPSGYYAKTEFNITFDRHSNADPNPNLRLQPEP